MEILILTTFSIILAFSAINALVNLFSYSYKKDEIYKLSALFWISLIINFILQGLAGENQALIIASFTFSIIPVNLLCISLYSILNEKYFTKLALTSGLISFISAITFCYFKLEFLYCALPLSIATAIPLGLTSFKLFFTDRNKRIFRIISLVLLLFLIHGFNFAFFRMDSSTQVWGWTVSYALFQAIAALLPIATLAEFHYRESSRMKEIIQTQTINLEQSNKNLKNTVNFKNFLFRTLAHDIATPLLVSKASLDTIKSKDTTILTNTNFARLDRSINKMIQISNDLKSIETQKLDIKIYSVLECIRSCEEILAAMIEDKQLRFIYDTHSLQNTGIFVHKTSFVNSVLGNLLRNSIKFSPRGESINIKAGFIDADQAWITVQNLGQPIPEKTLENIFDFNTEKTRPGSEGEQGTGWGLPICKVFLDNYKGKIQIKSLPTATANVASIEATLMIKGTIFNLDSLSVS